MTNALLIVLLVVLVVSVAVLIVGQVKTLRALGEAADSLRTLSEELRREGVPLLRETRASVAAATETLQAARGAVASLERIGPLLADMRPVLENARLVVSHADDTVVEARATVGTAQRVLAQVEAVVGRLSVTDVALEVIKAKGGEAGHLAANVGQLVKSLWHRRSNANGPESAPEDGQSAAPTPDGAGDATEQTTQPAA